MNKEIKDKMKQIKNIHPIPVKYILEYEIHSSWFAGCISFSWGQNLVSKYFSRKVRKKYKRYLASTENRNSILNSFNQD